MKTVRIPLIFDGESWCSEKLKQHVVLCGNAFRAVFGQVAPVRTYPAHNRCVLEIRETFVAGAVWCKLNKRNPNVWVAGHRYHLGPYTHAEFLKLFPGRIGYARIVRIPK